MINILTYKGRICRTGYWTNYFILGVMAIPLGIREVYGWDFLGNSALLHILAFAYTAFAFHFWFNIMTKRFHDLNMSGAYILGVLLVPFYNLYLLYKLFAVKGTRGENRFGNDPLRPKLDNHLEKKNAS